jgi:osmotically inducible protein OsmC
MALGRREATVIWEGTLGGGSGVVQAIEGATDDLPMDWASTDREADGTTSPEELLAAAEAGCYAMTLALALTRRGTPADRLAVRAECTIDRTGEDDPHEYRISALRLDVEGTVPRLEGDAAAFEELARHADEQCPVSVAVRGNVDVQVSATLSDSA